MKIIRTTYPKISVQRTGASGSDINSGHPTNLAMKANAQNPPTWASFHKASFSGSRTLDNVTKHTFWFGCSGSATWKLQFYEAGSSTVRKTQYITSTHQNPVGVVWVGHENTTPTYLETLDKLDQWSSAQYVPYGKSGNKLNL